MLTYTTKIEILLVAILAIAGLLGLGYAVLIHRHRQTRKALERVREERNELRDRLWSEARRQNGA